MTITMPDLSLGILPAGVLTGVTRFTEAQTGGADTVVLVGAVVGSAAINQQITTALSNGAVSYINIQNESSKTLLGNPTSGSQVPSEITLGTGLVFSNTTLGLLLRSYLAGFSLSNDVVTPNTVLDIGTGICSDSTNATMLALNSSFTKSIGGSWVAGSGANGMGVGLTAAINTWYYPFAIQLSNGATDVYFDSSSSAANAPTGVTAFRRLGSILLDGSAHIRAFIQRGSYFYWLVPIHDVATAIIGTAASTKTISVPPVSGIIAMGNAWILKSGVASAVVVYSPILTGAAYSYGVSASVLDDSGSGTVGYVMVPTDTGQITTQADGVTRTFDWDTLGWIDNLGRTN